ncbi:MAG: tryptophan 7-halogenase [Brevundimonas sp.]
MTAASGIRSVVVVGRDAAAWLSALTLQRAFGRTGLKVSVVAMPSLLTVSDVYAALPSLAGLHALLGLTDAEVLGTVSAVPVLGQRFADWNKECPSFLHAYDMLRVGIDDVDFVHFWVKARAEGLKVAFEDFSLGSVAAKQGRTVIDRHGFVSETPIEAGYALDAVGYVALLRRRAIQAGVSVISGPVIGIDRHGDRIAAVITSGDQRVEADLFIDASGNEAVLSRGQSGAFDSWRDLFGVDRLLSASAKALRPLPAFSQIAAFEAGWIGLYPLKDRTAVVAAWDSREMSDEDLISRLPVETGLSLDGERRITAFEPGMRPAWSGNCVAIGEAAVALEPLDAVQLQLTHLGLSQLVALFPVSPEAMPEAQAYNAGLAAFVLNVRDFQLAHYRLNGRIGEGFWDRARSAPVPEGLEARIRLFAARGKVAQFDEESFQLQSWIALFLGHGLIPASYDPRVDRISPEDQIARFRFLLGKVAEDVRAMPSVESQFGAGA